VALAFFQKMNSSHLFMLFWFGCLGLMVLAVLGIFIYKLLNPKCANPIMTESDGFVRWLSMAGILTFLTGMGWVMFNTGTGFALVVGGLAVVFASVFLNASAARKRRTASWLVVPARCTGQNLQQRNYDGTPAWSWNLTCEFTMNGKPYQITPKVMWNDLARSETPFWKEEEAWQFIAGAVPANSLCKLRVNPANPQEAELLAGHE
jgi:hypothetical protein